MKSTPLHAENKHDETALKKTTPCTIHPNEVVSCGAIEQPLEELNGTSTAKPTFVEEGARTMSKGQPPEQIGRAGSKFSKIAAQRPSQELFKLRDAAFMMSISPVSVRRLIKRGFLTPIRVLRHTLLSASEIHRFIEQASNSSASPKGNVPTCSTAEKTKKSSIQP